MLDILVPTRHAGAFLGLTSIAVTQQFRYCPFIWKICSTWHSDSDRRCNQLLTILAYIELCLLNGYGSTNAILLVGISLTLNSHLSLCGRRMTSNGSREGTPINHPLGEWRTCIRHLVIYSISVCCYAIEEGVLLFPTFAQSITKPIQQTGLMQRRWGC